MLSQDPLVADRIRQVAQRFAAKAKLQDADHADLHQDLWVALLAREPAFDPGRGSAPGFAHVVATSQAANLARDAKAAKRSPGRQVSIQQPIADVNGRSTELVNTLTGDARDENDATCLRMDMESFLEKLPPNLKEICRRRQTGTWREVAEGMGEPRTTVQSRFRKVRKLAFELGLQNYLR